MEVDEETLIDNLRLNRNILRDEVKSEIDKTCVNQFNYHITETSLEEMKKNIFTPYMDKNVVKVEVTNGMSCNQICSSNVSLGFHQFEKISMEPCFVRVTNIHSTNLNISSEFIEMADDHLSLHKFQKCFVYKEEETETRCEKLVKDHISDNTKITPEKIHDYTSSGLDLKPCSACLEDKSVMDKAGVCQNCVQTLSIKKEFCDSSFVANIKCDEADIGSSNSLTHLKTENNETEIENDKCIQNNLSDKAIHNDGSDETIDNNGSDETIHSNVSDKTIPNDGSNEINHSDVCYKTIPNEGGDKNIHDDEMSGDNDEKNGRVAVLTDECSTENHRNDLQVNGSKFHCKICGRYYTYKQNLQRHTRKQHKLKQLQSIHCNQKFHSKKDKPIHEKQHVNSSMFNCKICGRCYDYKRNLKRHMKGVHPEHIRNDFSCDSQLSSRKSPVYHEKRRKLNPVLCYSRTLNSIEKTKHHDKHLLDTSNETIQSGGSDEIIHSSNDGHSEDNLRNDNGDRNSDEKCRDDGRGEHNDKNFGDNDDGGGNDDNKCAVLFDECSTANHGKDLKVNNSKFKCEICGRYYSYTRGLNVHIRKEHESKALQCSHCSHTFNSKEDTEIHEKQHLNEKFKCKICWRYYTYKHGLKRHMQEKHMLKPLRCSHCIQTFSVEKDKEIHEKQHKSIHYKREHNNSSCDSQMSSRKSSVHQEQGQSLNPSLCSSQTVNQVEDICIKRVKRRRTEPSSEIINSDGINEIINVKLGNDEAYNDENSRDDGEKVDHCAILTDECSTASQGKDVKVNNSKFKCKICGQYYISKQSLKKHMRKIHKFKLYPCNYCPEKFDSADNRADHESHHTDAIRCFDELIVWMYDMRCLICGTVFQDRKKFREHIYYEDHCVKFYRFVKDDINYIQCPPCKFVVRYKTNKCLEKLMNHLVTTAQHGDMGCVSVPKSSSNSSSSSPNILISSSESPSSSSNTLSSCSNIEVKHPAISAPCSFISAPSNLYEISSCSDKAPSSSCLESSSNDNPLSSYENIISSSAKEFSYSSIITPEKISERSNCIASLDAENTGKRGKSDTCSTDSKLQGGWFCTMCNKVMKSWGKKSVLGHIKTFHTNEKCHRCEHCCRRYASESHLKEHMKASEDLLPCSECGLRFMCKVLLQRHEYEVHKSKRILKSFPCSICEKTFPSKFGRDRHETIHLERKDSICDQCGKGFKGVHLLNRHIKRVHTNEGQRTRNESVPCPECNKMFSRKYMYIHRLTHRERKISCDICNKRFIYKHHLQNHMVIHSGGRSFKCHVCDLSFNLKHHLHSHLKTKHGIFTFKK